MNPLTPKEINLSTSNERYQDYLCRCIANWLGISEDAAATILGMAETYDNDQQYWSGNEDE